MNKNRNRTFFAMAALCCLLTVACLTGCTKKRCLCITERHGYQNARGLEELGSHKNCSELDAEWDAHDSTAQIITKTCVPEPEN
ncbi:MAG: hypothetical protein J6W95_00900 [Bacteroidales bacterium]|nr:hypothetical protein [Bacteroidales bacterium]